MFYIYNLEERMMISHSINNQKRKENAQFHSIVSISQALSGFKNPSLGEHT